MLRDRPNIDFSVQWMFGDRDPVFNRFCSSHTSCLEKGWTDAKNRWNFGMAQLAGDARSGQRVFGAAMGCNGRPATTAFRAGVRKVYDSCDVRGTATSYVKVAGGQHGYPGLSGVNGFDPNAETWSFWSSHPASGARRKGRDAAPPSVVVTGPRARASVGKLRIAGRAVDRSGVRSVTLTIKRLGGGSRRCHWLDPRHGLVRRSCSSPVRLRARLGRHGDWKYLVPRGVTLPRGRYRVRVSGKDRAGNRGNLAAARKRAITVRLG